MLRTDYSTRYLIVEMGASGAGDIARLVAIARPDIAIVLKVGLAHVGEFGGIDAVQRAKSELGPTSSPRPWRSSTRTTTGSRRWRA